MGFGAYEITLRLQGSAFTLHQTFEIVSIESGLPEIILPDDIEILAIPPLYNGDVSLQYNLFNPAMNVVKQIEICIQMENVITGLVVLPQSCVRSDHNMIGLKAIVEGDYRITLICRLAFAPFTSYPNSEKTSMVYIRRSSAFLPTYEWKRVHAWESVPAGLEIRYSILFSWHIIKS